MKSTIPYYEPLSLKGLGTFGYVIEAYDHIHDEKVAIKRSYKKGTKLSREFENLSKLKDCQYIVELKDIFYIELSNGKIIQNLVFEFLDRSLEDYIVDFRRKKSYIPLDKIKQISRQLLLGLDFCHKKNIVHRDLKPDNILLTQDDQLKICDFGSSKCIKENTISTPYIACSHYRAPELILGKIDYNQKIDIFAAGCIIAELFILNRLLTGKLEGLQIFELMQILGNPGKKYFAEFNLPKNYVDFFDNVKIRGINKFDEFLNAEGFYDKR